MSEGPNGREWRVHRAISERPAAEKPIVWTSGFSGVKLQRASTKGPTVADKEVAAELRAEWKLAEGDVYDPTYIDRFLEANRDSLPLGFSRASVQTIQDCPDALVKVRLIVDPAEDTSHAELKNVLCEDHHDVSK